MARGTQHRKRRPRPSAQAVAQPAPRLRKPKQSAPSWQDELFFSRLKRHAKWVFVLLAVTFGLGFVIFGVGSGSTGISQAMENFFTGSSSGGSSLSSLQKKASQHPKVASNWRNLATKLEEEKKTDRAIVALEHYVALEPKDQGALEEVAGLYVQRAQDYYNLYAEYAAEGELVSPSSIFRPATTSPFGKYFNGKDPILTLQSKSVQTKVSSALQQLGVYDSKSEDSYKKLAAVAPDNATYQFQLAQVANSLGDKATAIVAYKAFLKLAPDDSLAPQAKAALKQLTAKPKAAKAKPKAAKKK